MRSHFFFSPGENRVKGGIVFLVFNSSAILLFPNILYIFSFQLFKCKKNIQNEEEEKRTNSLQPAAECRPCFFGG
jgi:hypothetical protein